MADSAVNRGAFQVLEQTEKPWRSAGDTIVSAMEEFGVSEPKGLVIIHTDESGGLVITANTAKCLALGMIEMARQMILNGEV